MHTRIAVVVILLLVGVAAPFAAPAAAQSGSAVGFGTAETTTMQGDIATVEIQVRNTDQALLRVRSADQQYRATVRVVDRDSDGTVNVQINTFRGPNSDDKAGFTATSGADSAELLAESANNPGTVLDTGRYNMIASTATTSVSAVLHISPPSEAESYTNIVAPGTPLSESALPANESAGAAASNSTAESSTADNQVPTAAIGDYVRTRFSVGGIGGAIDASPPARNLIFAADSSPSARTTHTMQTSPNQTVAMRSLAIDYGAGESDTTARVYRLTKSDIETLGIDENGDGYIDQSVRVAIQNIRTSTNGQVTLTFDRPITISPGERLLAVYKVENPDTLGPQTVETTLTGESATYYESGTILYGPAGQGTLGYGVNLQLESTTDKSSPTAPLSAVNLTYDTDTSELIADTDTSVLAPGEYAIRLHTEASAPAALPEVDLTEQFTTVKPAANITNHSIEEGSQLSVTAETNLAPKNTVIIRVDAQEEAGGISQVQNCVATVQPDGAINCGFDLSESGSDLTIDVSIRQNETMIAGPTRLTSSHASVGTRTQSIE